ncbi:MAG: UDP-glucose 4-epimerase [Solirubrobacteraceae bacterium]|nr:UDP-glucose 4-epimerase [Solirubrobacteraceae bacterium]
MRVVVTGATGNAGTALLRPLAGEDAVDEVVGIARRRPAAPAPKTTWATADVSRDDLVPLLRGADCVVHLAWLIQPSRHEAVTYATNVEGSQRVFDAAAAAGVPAIVYASSIGAYSPGPKDPPGVGESWPTEGTPTSFYSRHKADVERRLDAFEQAHLDIRVVRLRPGLKFQRAAATGIRRLFVGPFLPNALVRRGLVPVVPRHPRLRAPALHTDDVADAYRRGIVMDVRGAFNVAADPPLDGDLVAHLLGAKPVDVSPRGLRGLATLTWRAHLQPTEPGWVDMALAVPLMNTSRARQELGWAPRHGADEAFLELFEGLHDGAGHPTPPLDPRTSGPMRAREVLTGVGRTSM